MHYNIKTLFTLAALAVVSGCGKEEEVIDIVTPPAIESEVTTEVMSSETETEADTEISRPNYTVEEDDVEDVGIGDISIDISDIMSEEGTGIHIGEVSGGNTDAASTESIGETNSGSLSSSGNGLGLLHQKKNHVIEIGGDEPVVTLWLDSVATEYSRGGEIKELPSERITFGYELTYKKHPLTVYLVKDKVYTETLASRISTKLLDVNTVKAEEARNSVLSEEERTLHEFKLALNSSLVNQAKLEQKAPKIGESLSAYIESNTIIYREYLEYVSEKGETVKGWSPFAVAVCPMNDCYLVITVDDRKEVNKLNSMQGAFDYFKMSTSKQNAYLREFNELDETSIANSTLFGGFIGNVYYSNENSSVDQTNVLADFLRLIVKGKLD